MTAWPWQLPVAIHFSGSNSTRLAVFVSAGWYWAVCAQRCRPLGDYHGSPGAHDLLLQLAPPHAAGSEHSMAQVSRWGEGAQLDPQSFCEAKWSDGWSGHGGGTWHLGCRRVTLVPHSPGSCFSVEQSQPVLWGWHGLSWWCRGIQQGAFGCYFEI